MTFTEETRRKHDALSVPQIVLKYAQLHKEERPAYTKEEMMELLDILVDRRVHETGGPPGIEGTMKPAIAHLIKPSGQFYGKYEAQPYTTTQFKQAEQIINLFGRQFFNQKNLLKIYDRKTAKIINDTVRSIKDFDNERFMKKIINGGNPSGFIENINRYDIELQLYFQNGFNHANINPKLPIWIAEKQGKTKNLSFKQKNEIGTNLPLVKEGTLSKLDPYMLIACYFEQEDYQQHPLARTIFDHIQESEMRFLEEIREWRDKHKEDHPKLSKPDEQRVKTICDRLRPHTNNLPKEQQEQLLEHAILTYGNIDDMRGIKIVLPDDADFDRYVHQLTKHPTYYEKKGFDYHDGTKTRKTTYRAFHAWLLSDRFGPEHARHLQYGVAERKEIHLLNMTTGINDLIGEDNGWSYHQRQQREKYGHFNKQQKAIADFAEKRLYALADSITEPFKEVLKERKSEFDNEKKYYEVLAEQADRSLLNLATH